MSNKPLPLEPDEGSIFEKPRENRARYSKRDEKRQECRWRPAYLQRRVLIVFIIVFCAVIAALEVLNHVSQVNFGIASSVNSRHYSRTYGPTAILTVVAAVWSRLEFQAKQNAPWQAMQQGPTDASQSVLLDYISAMQPVALSKAFKNRHIVVFSAISCSVLIRLAIIFSTDLFALREVQVQRNGVEVQLLDTFIAGEINSVTIDNPFDVLNEVLFNASYPDGTTKDVTFQRFSASNVSSDTILSVQVKALEINLTCESAELHLEPAQFRHPGSVTIEVDNFQRVTIVSPSCTNSNITIDDSMIVGPHYLAQFRTAQCDGTTGDDWNRIVIIAAQIQEARNQTPPPGNPRFFTKNITVDRSVQMICKLDHFLIDLNITRNASESSSNVQVARIGSKESCFDLWHCFNVVKWPISYAVSRWD